MRRIALAAFAIFSIFNLQSSICFAQTNMTTKYIENPNFEARFAGWDNAGSFTFNTSKNFAGQDGMVFMEKWVSKGNSLGTNTGMKQTLVGLPAGTYTLTVNAQNIQQSSEVAQTGAFIYAGDEQTEVSAYGQYSVVFTVLTGQTVIGFKLKTCTGNWACIDNFKLYSNGIVKDSVNLELQKLITEAEGVIGDGVTAPALQTAIDDAKALLTAEGDYQAVAKALESATLNYRVQNATGTAPTVTTNEFIAAGSTIALGRLTVKGTASERGFCWSTEPEPTVLDNRSTRYFSNNGNIYVMEHMQPATIYYVRAYAMTKDYKVGYGEVVKMATLPKGSVSTSYEDYNGGTEQEDFRIESAVNECKWMYNNLTNIRDFNLRVHYVPGSGAGGGTAECSYGGWMNVSQTTSYQQTGTILHETNHGVGVGTTGEWYNNSNLRAETSRGIWLGPRANQMIRFLENNNAISVTGDNTHMWGTPTDQVKLAYGINGAHEDAYNPENTLLYYSNILITHALHQDGLICTSNVGFATPAYVFRQDDNQKYYIKNDEAESTGYLTMSSTGALSISTYDATNDDMFAWNITYDPKTSYYIFRNVGTGRYLTYSSGFKGVTRTTPASTDKFHLLPARAATKMGNYNGTGYWIVYNKGTNTLKQNGAKAASASLDFSNAATNQRWLFLTEAERSAYDTAATPVVMPQLEKTLTEASAMLDTPHKAQKEGGDITAIDSELGNLITTITEAKSAYTTPGEVITAADQLKAGMLTFIGEVNATDMSKPFDITFALNNPGLDGTNGWSTAATNNYSCCEFFEQTFDFNQSTAEKMPIGTFELRVQAFQRPGTAANTYNAFVVEEKDSVNAFIYIKSATNKQLIKNIWADAQSKGLGGATYNKSGKYIPNNMLAASKWFDAGWYENSVMVTQTSKATLKVGIKATKAPTSYWTCFDNFRLYYYGNVSQDDITGIEEIRVSENEKMRNEVYDLSGRRVLSSLTSHPSPLKKGLYIVNGKKVLIK